MTDSSQPLFHHLDLDALEARAGRALVNLYGHFYKDDKAAFWVQKGIEGMRLAVAEALEKAHDAE